MKKNKTMQIKMAFLSKLFYHTIIFLLSKETTPFLFGFCSVILFFFFLFVVNFTTLFTTVIMAFFNFFCEKCIDNITKWAYNGAITKSKATSRAEVIVIT